MIIDTSYCASKISDIHGRAGEDWLEGLPALLAECSARWSLAILPPFPVPSYNYVAPVVGPEGQQLVLKAGVPHSELWSEIDALRVFHGRGMARLLDADRDRGVLLLERVSPGGSLWTVDGEEEQVAALVSVLQRLWRPLPAGHQFRTIADLARGLDRLQRTFGGFGPFPQRRVERARELFEELTGGAEPPLLIHGDANPGNILRSDRDSWLAIDPKGYAGHPLFDLATYLNDPPEGLAPGELKALQARRVAALAEAVGQPPGAILAWAEAHAVLSSWWTYEEHGGLGERELVLAELYERLARAA